LSQPALIFVQPVTGFQVASVHSMVVLSAIIKPVRFANDDENDSFEKIGPEAQTREHVRRPMFYLCGIVR
jgi:hypothetical protein